MAQPHRTALQRLNEGGKELVEISKEKAEDLVTNVKRGGKRVALRAWGGPSKEPLSEVEKKKEQKRSERCRVAWLSILFGLALLFNTLASVSIPNLSGSQDFLIQTEFNENTFNGLLNGVVVVENMKAIRLGLWAACYFDLRSPDGDCLPKAVAYEVIITVANTSESNTVVQPVFTGLALVQVAAAASTFIASIYMACHSCKNPPSTWLTNISTILTAATLGVDYFFLKSTSNGMQQLGAGVETKLGPSFVLTMFAFVLLLFRSLHQIWEKFVENYEKGQKSESESKKFQRGLLTSNAKANYTASISPDVFKSDVLHIDEKEEEV